MEHLNNKMEHVPPKNLALPASIVLASLIIAGTIYRTRGQVIPQSLIQNEAGTSISASLNSATNEVTLPVVWGTLGAQLIAAGVIDEQAFRALYDDRGGLTQEDEKLLTGTSTEQLVLSAKNSGTLLNLLWALGLANKNGLLTAGPMQDPAYGGAANFASTGGWSLARGKVMDHYAAHVLLPLSPAQEQLVTRVAKNIYRPCCDNATHFPDCNHGMAMLGLLELMASQGKSEAELYEAALAVNNAWFPNQYATIKTVLAKRGQPWQTIEPKILLGKAFASASGYRVIAAQVTPAAQKSGTGCAV